MLILKKRPVNEESLERTIDINVYAKLQIKIPYNWSGKPHDLKVTLGQAYCFNPAIKAKKEKKVEEKPKIEFEISEERTDIFS